MYYVCMYRLTTRRGGRFGEIRGKGVSYPKTPRDQPILKPTRLDESSDK